MTPELFTITCGKCGETHPLETWVNGLPSDTFCCPGCAFAFRRQRKRNRRVWDKFVELVPVEKEVDDIWRDPTVREALKERDSSDIAILTCPKCHKWGYWNEGSHFTCNYCDISFVVLGDEETNHHDTNWPVVRTGDRMTLADTIEPDEPMP